ncbi:hypothetical protein SPRG_22190 [Saprolegnia parasitica CBS 223.65]|uniref:Uncharacterized protein n=1 Tax=Saprolegnia parasitica (strain CBS 223.65) TaxID=695850 RepID=A0A067CNG6_SAPPC|nr:hypothetical protein SPRG_22190 [Saprolegnia parasitica CBS 223.65]KDO28086.1 hypothetical protein SPRG_22190 [Saprolegnia parasitica CBS 223.65]|eukprot:XP_012201280.1 hypothetical protein SPRG_22190 [Saprolegnia parasitica CBS 223.65]
MAVLPESLLIIALVIGGATALYGHRCIHHIGLALLLLEYFFILTLNQVAAVVTVLALTVYLVIAKSRHVLADWAYAGLRVVICLGGILGLCLFLYYANATALDVATLGCCGATALIFVGMFAFCDDRVSFIVTTSMLGTVLVITTAALWDNDDLVLQIWHLPTAAFLLLCSCSVQWHAAHVSPAPSTRLLWETPRHSNVTAPATPTPKAEIAATPRGNTFAHPPSIV